MNKIYSTLLQVLGTGILVYALIESVEGLTKTIILFTAIACCVGSVYLNYAKPNPTKKPVPKK